MPSRIEKADFVRHGGIGHIDDTQAIFFVGDVRVTASDGDVADPSRQRRASQWLRRGRIVEIDDVVDAYFLAAAHAPTEFGSIYNVGSGTQTSLRDVVEIVRRVMAIEEEPQWGSMANRKWDTSLWVSDCGKIRTELGWRPSLNFEDGFHKFVQWFDDHPELVDFYEKHPPI